MTAVHDITALAQNLFSADVAVGVVDIAASKGMLYPQERAAIQRATAGRRQEFVAGRTAARLAMKRLRVPAGPVEMGADRAPVWPEGVVGSLSHSDRDCIAVLAKSGQVKSLGVDLEPADPLPEDLGAVICTDAELNWLNSKPNEQRGFLAKMIFSAKECTYKCQYPLSGELIDFSAIEIEIDEPGGQFAATFTRPVGEFGTGCRLSGRLGRTSGMILTTMMIADRRKTTILN